MRSHDRGAAPSRRDFMKVAASYLAGMTSVLGLAALGRYLGYKPDSPAARQVDLGPTADLPRDSSAAIYEIPALVTREQDGYSALSLVCTHLGCTLGREGDGFACPCHGSEFTRQGTVQRGPAGEPLRPLRTEITEDDRLIIHID